VTGITSGGDFELCLGGLFTISEAINAGGNTVRLQITGAGVTQDAGKTITAGGLGIRAAGAINLDNANNDVNTIAFVTTAAGAVEFTNVNGLSIGSVTASTCFTPLVNGITSNSGLIYVTNETSGGVTVSQAVSAGGGSNVTLAAEEAGTDADLTINANILTTGGTGNISLFAGDTISTNTTAVVSTVSTGAILVVLRWAVVRRFSRSTATSYCRLRGTLR
jgi:hypothetical protein